jgi:hypothetical protein
MKLQAVGPPDRGSLSVVYSCPECGYEIAMLTNAYETQVVQSLGVRIGPGASAAAPGGDRRRAEGASAGQAEAAEPVRDAADTAAKAGGCPFASMIPGAQDTRPGVPGDAGPVRWTAAAEARLLKVPEFVRPMARTGIERFARERGASEIDEQMLDAAREFFGM